MNSLNGRTSKAGDLSLALLNDGKVENAQLLVNDATANTLALALACAAGLVTLGG